LIWGVQLGLGTMIPLFLLRMGRATVDKSTIILASLLFIVGGIAQVYALVIGGQAYPMPLLDGYQIESSFHGAVASYTPSHWEIMLGCGGFAIALLITIISLRLFPLIPESK